MQTRQTTPGAPKTTTLVALIALVASLGAGTALALPGKGSVKKGDIAKNAVGTKQVAQDAATGKDVNEAKLGTVPSAESAASVAVIRSLGAPATISEGQTRDLFTQGPFSAVLSCVAEGATTTAVAVAQTTEANTLLAGDQNQGLIGPGTPEEDRVIHDTALDVPGGEPDPSDGDDDQFILQAPSGAILAGTIDSLADADTGECTVWGYLKILR